MNMYGIIFLAVIPVGLVLLRALFLVFRILTSECNLHNSKEGLKTIYCIGSGGHTTELLRLTKSLKIEKYHPRLYILADNDTSSEVKVHKNEDGQKNYSVTRIPRSRNVKQSYFSSVVSTLYALLQTIPIVYRFKPDVIFSNGPGTCVPICLIAFILRCLFILDCRIIFIESICRVRTLSLTGKILQFFADVFVVQWPQMRDVCFRSKYFGRLT